MTKTSKPTRHAINFLPILLVLVVISFFAGRIFSQKNNTQNPDQTDALAFSATQNNQPEFIFYVMSFCPYGNQIESVIKPVYDLLGDKVNWQPKYIFSQVQDIAAFCEQRIYNPERCASYIDQGYFTTQEACKLNFVATQEECKNQFLLETADTAYSSLHGRGELNQDVREICAYDQDENKNNWWNFVGLVNKNCNANNVDSCWEQQAKDSGFDTEKIKTCFNEHASQIINQQLADTQEHQISSSPTVLINGQFFPPEEIYKQENGQLKVNDQLFTPDQLRTPEALKQAICASFKKAPKECKTKLENQPDATATQGGC